MSPPNESGATLVLASYNHSLYVREALECVAAQDYPNLRLIVTDDASTDDSVQVIEQALSDLGLDARTQFQTRNKGICATFNAALATVDTPFVAFLAADDLMHPSRFSRQIEALSAEPDSALLYGDMWVNRPADGPESALYSSWLGGGWKGGHHEQLFRNLAVSNWIPAPTVLARTDALCSVGGYDECLEFEDRDMWLRLSRRYPFAFLDEPLVTWRLVPYSLSTQLDGQTELKRRLLDVSILSKHLGCEDEIDEWLVPRIAHLAITNYKHGDRSQELARVLRHCLRKKPSLPAARYALSATLQSSRAGT